MKKPLKLKPYHVPNIVLKIAVVLVLTGFLYFEGMSIYFLLSDPGPLSGDNTYYWPLLSNASPLVIFTLAYFMNPRRLNVWAKLFESILLTIVGVVVQGIITTLVGFVPDAGENGFGVRMTIGYVLGLVAFAGLLFWMRRTKRWA